MYTSGLLLQLIKAQYYSIFRDGFHHGYPVPAVVLSCVFLLPVMLCPDLLLKALLYFWPLLVSTGICLTAFYLFFFQTRNRSARGDVLLIKVGRVEHLVEIRVSGEAKFGVCSDHVKVNCSFLVGKSLQAARGSGRASSGDLEPPVIGDEEGFDHRPAPDEEYHQEVHPTASSAGRQGGEVEEDDDIDGGASQQIRADGLAESLWNCYFGSYSKWHYDEDADLDAQVMDLD